jgi:hypothetical protein
MNEQIRELAKQAGGHKCLCIDSITLSLLGENSIEKFAELLVEKCAAIIESQDVDPSFKLRMSWAVKQYFGVEQ